MRRGVGTMKAADRIAGSATRPQPGRGERQAEERRKREGAMGNTIAAPATSVATSRPAARDAAWYGWQYGGNGRAHRMTRSGSRWPGEVGRGHGHALRWRAGWVTSLMKFTRNSGHQGEDPAGRARPRSRRAGPPAPRRSAALVKKRAGACASATAVTTGDASRWCGQARRRPGDRRLRPGSARTGRRRRRGRSGRNSAVAMASPAPHAAEEADGVRSAKSCHTVDGPAARKDDVGREGTRTAIGFAVAIAQTAPTPGPGPGQKRRDADERPPRSRLRR